MERKPHKVREFVRDKDGKMDRLLFLPELYDSPGEPVALVVRENDVLRDVLDHVTGLCRVEREVVSLGELRMLGDGPDAADEPLDPMQMVPDLQTLTRFQTRWLHKTLGELVGRWDEEERTREERATCARCGKMRSEHERGLRLTEGDLDEPTVLRCTGGGEFLPVEVGR